jgi:hypothetical protein
MGVSTGAWMAVVRRPSIGWVRMPRILVRSETELWLVGPGMGERLKGLAVAAISGMVWQSMNVRIVRPVPPEMVPLWGVLAGVKEWFGIEVVWYEL